MANTAKNLEVQVSDVERRLIESGFELPQVQAQGAYRTAKLHAGMVSTAGQLSRRSDGSVFSGIATCESDLETAEFACQLALLRTLAAVRSVVNLDRVSEVISLKGFICSSSGFHFHTRALDAASEILWIAFGKERGAHIRSALGVASLPSAGMAELELVVAIRK